MTPLDYLSNWRLALALLQLIGGHAMKRVGRDSCKNTQIML
ncbi:hypothetical protein [Janthinobacterium sp.]|nr:hypothetical protein [Janthinobacterium sp.]